MSAAPVYGIKLPGVTYVDRPGAYGLIRRDDSWLFVETPNGVFLPGGGIEPGESPEQALAREVTEETGFELGEARYAGSAEQYHWSHFYQRHFRKIGMFFETEVREPGGAIPALDHEILWVRTSEARRALTMEFQRYALDLV